MRLPFSYCIILLIMLAVVGCASTPPSQHYFLTPIDELELSDTRPSIQSEINVIAVLVRTPRYLDRPQIVTRIGPNEFKLDEFNRWTGSFKDNIANVMVQNFKYLLPNATVVRFPVPRAMNIDYKVLIDISRFDGTRGASVTLQTTWALLIKGDNPNLETAHFVSTVPVASKDYNALAKAKSRALAELSQAIAKKIQHLN
jgi:uncharacterized lipoprotein YmbA